MPLPRVRDSMLRALRPGVPIGDGNIPEPAGRLLDNGAVRAAADRFRMLDRVGSCW